MAKIVDIEKIVEKEPRITCTTWQSIYKLQTPWFEKFGMVIGDEAHTFKAKSLTSIMSKCKEAEYRIGTTGTLDGSQCFDRNTLISTQSGQKRIDDITPGDLVTTFNESTCKLQYKPVLNVFNNGNSKKMYKVKTDKGEMTVTGNHKVFTTNGWKVVKDLMKNDKIISLN